MIRLPSNDAELHDHHVETEVVDTLIGQGFSPAWRRGTGDVAVPGWLFHVASHGSDLAGAIKEARNAAARAETSDYAAVVKWVYGVDAYAILPLDRLVRLLSRESRVQLVADIEVAS